MPIVQSQTRKFTKASGSIVQSACLLLERMSHLKLSAAFVKDHMVGTIITVPPTIHHGDPESAKQAYHGEFVFRAGSIKPGQKSPFHISNLPDALADELLSFTWLNHLQAADNEISRAHARRLISDWIAAAGLNRTQAWKPIIIARRLTSWLTSSSFYLKNAPADFKDTLLNSMMTQVTFLAFTAHRTTDASERLETLINLATISVCLEGKSRLLTKTLAYLEKELAEQILPDGGHIDRTPSSVVNFLGDLIILRETLISRDYVVPKSVLSAIDRMLPMLKFFQLGDRGLVYFHGNNERQIEKITQVLRFNPNPGQPLGHALHSGFQRLDQGKTIVVMDVGTPPPGSSGKNIHASCLAFEMSHGPHRIIVNCGAADDPTSDWYEAAGRTAAHSTLTLDETDQNFSARKSFWRKWLNTEQGSTSAVSNRSNIDGNILVEAKHNGYLARFDLHHKRRLYLSQQGHDLRGEDIIHLIDNGMFRSNSHARPFAIRFHIHPDVKVTRSQNARSVLLLLPDRTGWTFSAAGASLELATSVYLDHQTSPRHSQQIVLHGTVENQSQVKWALKRLDKTKTRKRSEALDFANLPLI